MYIETAASYTPDYQVIRLKSVFQPFADPENPQPFETPHQAGFFIHEWIHFLHNLSTLHGICAYSHAVLVWSNVRTFIYEDDPEIDGSLAIQHNADIQRQFNYRLYARKSKNNNLPTNLVYADIEFLSCESRSSQIDDDPRYECTDIVCKVKIAKAEDSQLIEIAIGCHEIIESVAFMLEERFLARHKEIPAPTKIDPYYLVKGLAALIAPSLSSETVLRCALLSLQHLDPPKLLTDLLKFAQKACESNKNPDTKITEIAKSHLLNNQKAIEENIAFIESMFAVDEPMARAVKYTTGKMRNNYIHRLSDPFFEIALIDKLAAKGEIALFFAMERFGVGFLIQERGGDEDEPMKDLMYDISLEDKNDPDLSSGRRIAQAAFSYVFQFFKDKPNELTQPTDLKCPFYTCCNSDFRRNNATVCRKTPWFTQDLDLSNMCFFGRAVINTKGVKRAEAVTS